MKSSAKAKGCIVEDEYRDWSALPDEILEVISSYLYDIRPFHWVCRSWHVIKDLKKRNPLQPPEEQSQWLFHKPCGKSKYHFFHPVYKELKHTRPAENMIRAVPRYSRDGWILMSLGECSMLFYNPFTNAVIRLPDLPEPYDFNGAIFSLTPYSSNCVIFGISGLFQNCVRISTLSRGKEHWALDAYDNNLPFIPSSCTPVFHNKMAYCLGVKGNLGVYNPAGHKWIVLDKPRQPCRIAHENYLVDCEGEIISVFLGLLGSWVSVFKLDESKMTWEKLYTLGDYALFISIPISFSTRNIFPEMKNKIFFPFFHDNYIVYYSLDTQKFHTFGGKLFNQYTSGGDEIAEPFNGCWIEPSTSFFYEKDLEWLSCSEARQNKKDLEWLSSSEAMHYTKNVR